MNERKKLKWKRKKKLGGNFNEIKILEAAGRSRKIQGNSVNKSDNGNLEREWHFKMQKQLEDESMKKISKIKRCV